MACSSKLQIGTVGCLDSGSVVISFFRGKYIRIAQAFGDLRVNDDRGGVVVRPLPSMICFMAETEWLKKFVLFTAWDGHCWTHQVLPRPPESSVWSKHKYCIVQV